VCILPWLPCAKECEKCPNGGKTEKLAVLEQLLEDIIESKGARNTLGVVFVDKRITALALYDYFQTRRKEMKNGTWIHVEETKFNRNVGGEGKDVWFVPNIVRASKKPHCDISNRQYQEMNFSVDELDAEIINDILESCLPDGISMDDIVYLEPSSLEIPSNVDQTIVHSDREYQEIRW